MAERSRPLTTGSSALLGLTELNQRFTALQKEFAELRDQLNVFENWNSEIKTMYGKDVRVTNVVGTRCTGSLVWTDRYNICIEQDCTDPRDGKLIKHRVIYNKGCVATIELSLELGEGYELEVVDGCQ